MKKVSKIAIAISSVLLCCLVLFFFFKKPQTLSAAWWNDSWSYRQKILVTNNTTIQSNVYITLTLNTDIASTSMQADCGDFRFVKTNGEILPYYIVSGCRSVNNVIHVNFNTFPAGPQEFYFYYGNPSVENGFASSDFATSASSYTVGTVDSQEVRPGVSFGKSVDDQLNDGLVGYWKMDETATTSGAIDFSGSGNDGLYNGSASTTAGKFGRGGVFDGGSDYIEIADDSALNTYGSDYTISAWVNLDSYNSGSASMIFGRFTEFGGLELKIRGDSVSDPHAFGIKHWPTNNYELISSSTISLNTWHHLVVTYDHSRQEVNAYLDGTLDKNEQNVSPHVNIEGHNAHIGIDSRDEAGLDFDGKIDEIRLYRRTLSPSEVRHLYEWAPGPVLHLKMDEKGGTTSNDSSGYGNNGNFVGAPAWLTGKYGSSLSFNGSSYVDMGDVLDIGPTDLTISAWVKPDRTDRTMGIVAKANNGIDDGRYAIMLSSNSGNARLRGVFDPRNGTALDGNINIGKEWTFVTAVYDRDGYMSLYVNGVFDVRTDISIGSSSSFDIVDNLIVGMYDNPGSYTLEGSVDDVRIYNYARTQKQILEDMNGGGPALDLPVVDISFDEGVGSVVHDESGNNNNGTPYPGTGGSQTATSSMWDLGGKFGGAMQFDGVDDYINAGNSTSIQLTSQGTLSAWVKFTNTALYPVILGNANFATDRNGYLLYANWQKTGDFYLQLNDASGWIYIKTDNGGYNDNKWHHVVGTFDGRYMNIYVDGERAANPVAQTRNAVSGLHNLTVGKDPANPATYWNGFIDEVKIYNFALNVDEVKSLYNQSKSAVIGQATTANSSGTTVSGKKTEYCVPGDTATCTPPVLELKMDEKSGVVANDSSGNGNNGILFNADWQGAGCFQGACILLNDSLDNLLVGNSTLFNIVDNTMTVSLRFKISNNTQLDAWNRKLLNFGYQNGYYLSYRGDIDRICFSKYNSSDILLCASNVGASDKEWHEVVGVGDVDGMKIYFDGKMLASNSNSDNFLAPLNEYGVLLGCYGNTVCSNSLLEWNGYIDDVRIYDYARTPAQIAWDYNHGKPVAEWRFDECQNGTIHDESGNGLHGALSIGATGVTATGTCAINENSFWYNGRMGKNNSSGSFDGVSDYIEFGDIDMVDNFEQMSSCLWVYHNTISNDDMMIQNWGAIPGGFTFWRDDVSGISGRTDVYRISVQEISGNSGRIESDSGVSPLQRWTHVCFTYIENNSTGLRLYVNGEEVGDSPVDTNSMVDIDSGTGTLHIGRNYDNSGHFNGQIDDVKIWNYALTAEQVKGEYSGGAVNFK